MNRAIIIGSFVGSLWLKDCIDSMPRDIPVIVVCEPNYECGKIGWVHRHTNLDEFIFLPDTTVAKKHEWIREAFERQGSVSVNNEPAPMGSFMGKYRRQILDITGIPHTPDKSSAVDAEAMWTRKYCASETTPVHVLFPDFQHGPNPAKLEYKHGRLNAVIENDHLIKWKGTWHGGLIGEAEARDRQLTGRI